MDDVFVAIPWRIRDEPYRLKSLKFIINHLKSCTDIDPVLVDGNGSDFSLSAARNVAVNLAKENNKKIVIICDADTVIESDALINAINLSRSSKNVILPYTLCKSLTKRSSSLYYEGHNPSNLPVLGAFDWSTGGAYVTSVSSWEYLGGQDERFTNWGCEDTAFSIVAKKMRRPLLRVPGTIYSLYHTSYAKPEDEWYKYNSDLLKWYSQAKPRHIKKMLKEKTKGNP